MPHTPFKLPYVALEDDALINVQAFVCRLDKRTIQTSLGLEHGTHALIIQHAYQRLAKFIRDNNLNDYNSDHSERIVNFIRNGADTRPVGDTTAHPPAGSATGGKQKTARVPRKSATAS